MKKVFIFSICGECDEPTGIIEPCTELGYNNFPSTNFHGELSIEETEQLRQKLIQSLKDEGKLDKANYNENKNYFSISGHRQNLLLSTKQRNNY